MIQAPTNVFWLSLRDEFTHTMRHLKPTSSGRIEPLVRPESLDANIDDIPTIPWKHFVAHEFVQGPVLWLVHGYNAEFPVAAKAYRQIRATIDDRVRFYNNLHASVAIHLRPWIPRTIIQVLWAGGWSGLASFAPAWHRAKTAGRLLAGAIDEVVYAMHRSCRSSSAIDQRIVGHSMGCRVIGETFKHLASRTLLTMDFQVFLANAAIDKDALDKEYSVLSTLSQRCVAFTSQRDPVLKLYPFGRALTTWNPARWTVPALGLGTTSRGGITNVDYSSHPEHASDHGGARKTKVFYQSLLN
ncbi:MAG: alpha/beta hydrolase [Bryobacteraceae bacterium]